MNTEQKKQEIKKLVSEMLEESHEAMKAKIDVALNSGAIDVDKWENANGKMILPKCIVTALLEDESTKRDASGTSFEKYVKKEVKNIKYFL